MFSLLMPPRPLLPQPTATLSSTQCSFTAPSTPAFSHLALFMHPNTALPPGTLAAVYLKLPEWPEFKLLGALDGEKMSAVYRVNAGKGAAGGSGGQSEVREEVMLDDLTEQPAISQDVQGEVVVGISIEPAAQVSSQLASLKSSPQSQLSLPANGLQSQANGTMPSGDVVKQLAQKIGQNAFNFLAGFAEQSGGREVVPMKAFQEWWGKFEKKVAVDPGFVLRDGDG